MYSKKLSFGMQSKPDLSTITKLKKGQIIKEEPGEDNEDEAEAVMEHSKYTHSTSKEANITKTRRTKSTKKFKDASIQKSDISKSKKEAKSKKRTISIDKMYVGSGSTTAN